MKTTLCITSVSLLAGCGGVVDMGSEVDPTTTETQPFEPALRQFAPWIRGMCGLFSDERVRCWDGARSACLIDVPGVEGRALTATSAGHDPGALCVVSASGSVTCAEHRSPYGENWTNCIPRVETRELPGVESVVGVSAGVPGVAILADGRVQLWGASFTPCMMPAFPEDAPIGADLGGYIPDWVRPPIELPGRVVRAHAGTRTCFVLESGEVYCGGPTLNNVGLAQDQGCEWPPVKIPDIDDAVDVTGTMDTTCVLHQSGRVTCLGSAQSLGTGDSTVEYARGTVAGIDDAVALRSSRVGTCALRSDGSLWCWGLSWFGTYGVSSSRESGGVWLYTPLRVAGFENVRDFGMTDHDTCVVVGENAVSCLGALAQPSSAPSAPVSTLPFPISFH